MAERRQIAPEDCPTPEYHRTHRYCPSCSWTEADDAPPCRSVLDHMTNQSLSWKCESYDGHAGDHYRTLPDYTRPTKLTWN